MAEATNKAAKIETFLTSITGVDRLEVVRANRCVTCSGDATVFVDELSKREYSISGMCQGCQDQIFGGD